MIPAFDQTAALPQRPALLRQSPAFSPSFTRALPSIYLGRLCRQARSLCLTFDDGPGPILTREVHALLDAHGAHATFFALGCRASVAPDLLDESVRRGHEVGCHTHHHSHAWRSRGADAVADIRDGYDSLAAWTPPCGMFRPPYGKMSARTVCEIRRRLAPVGWWTIDGGDTRASLPSRSAAAVALARADGGVVLLHDFDRTIDTAARMAYVLRVAESLLATARREGLAVRLMSDLLNPGDNP